MSLPNATAWEVRVTGADTNGGGYTNLVPGTSVDYSQQAAAQLSPTDLACANSTTLTSAVGGFTASMQGNLIQIAGGTNFTAGFYQIVAYTNSNTVALDRNPTSGAAATLGTGAIGGALATPGKAFAAMLGSNICWIQQGVYSLPAVLPALAGGGSGAPVCVFGYKAIRGDGDGDANYGNCPTLRAVTGFPTTGGTSNLLKLSGNYYLIRNLILDANSIAVGGGYYSGAGIHCDNVKVMGFTGVGVTFNSNFWASRCTVAGGLAGSTAAFLGNGVASAGQFLFGCVAQGNACPGFLANGPGVSVVRCLAIGNTGAGSHGIYLSNGSGAGQGGTLLENTVAGNGGDGIRLINTPLDQGQIRGNLIANNGGYGLHAMTSGTAYTDSDYNGFYNNTSGSYLNVPAGAHDATATADPFVSSAGGNYALNNSGLGGGLFRGKGETVGDLRFADDGRCHRHRCRAVGGGGRRGRGLEVAAYWGTLVHERAQNSTVRAIPTCSSSRRRRITSPGRPGSPRRRCSPRTVGRSPRRPGLSPKSASGGTASRESRRTVTRSAAAPSTRRLPGATPSTARS